jgi:hypothetical protein
MADSFKMLKKAKGKDIFPAQSGKPEGLAGIIAGYSDYLHHFTEVGVPDFKDCFKREGALQGCYDAAKGATNSINCSRDDVLRFAERLYSESDGPVSPEKLLHGPYLAALINKVIADDDVMEIRTKYSLPCLGAYLERGTLKIVGDAGYCAGYQMSGGRLEIIGDSGEFSGKKMSRGDIVISGYARDIGDQMSGGNIIVSHTCWSNVGNHMTGGKIDVAMDATGLVGLGMSGGEIYVHGHVNDNQPFYSVGHGMSGGKIHIGAARKSSIPDSFAGGNVTIDNIIEPNPEAGDWVSDEGYD